MKEEKRFSLTVPNSGGYISDVRHILASARQEAYKTVNILMVERIGLSGGVLSCRNSTEKNERPMEKLF